MKQRPNTIWDIIKPYYRILKFFGLAVFSVKGKVVDGNIQSRPIEVLHFFFVLSIQIYVLYINIALDLSLSRTNSFLIDKGAHGIEIFNGINVVLGSCLYVFYRKRIWRIFRKCHEFDEEMIKLGVYVNENGKNRLKVFCGLGVIGYIAMIAATYFMIEEVIDPRLQCYFAIAYTSSNLYSTLFVVAFCLVLFLIQHRYSVINDCIRANFKTEDEDPIKVFDKKFDTPEKLIIKLADLHDSLNDVVNEMNQCFCLEIMLFFASVFLFNIFSTFALYRIFVRQKYTYIFETIIQSSWNLYFYVYCVVTISLSSMLTRCGKFSAVLCHKAINYSDDDSIIDHFRLFSQQLRHRSPVVSCGLFTFDFTLLFTILGATATYIVILIQFDSTPETVQATIASNTTELAFVSR